MQKKLPAFDELTVLTSSILNPRLNYSAVREACVSLSNLFARLSGFDESSPENLQPLITVHGTAISPRAAFFCIHDLMRTRSFLLGLREAVFASLNKNPGKPVHILYAGCGPFATLVSPLTTFFSKTQLQLSLLEVNEQSFFYLQKIVDALQLRPYIRSMVNADAASYRLPNVDQPDILLCEVMKPALDEEPQVAIVSNLLPQCPLNTLLIPQCIKIEFCFLAGGGDIPYSVMPVSSLLNLDAKTTRNIFEAKENIPVFSDGMKLQIAAPPPLSFNRLALTTAVEIFGNYQLGLNESGITLPKTIADVSTIRKWPAYFQFKYLLGNPPGFSFSQVNMR